MNKINFNNLFDSIIILLLELCFISAYSLVMVFGVIKNDGTNKTAICIVYSAIFIPSIILLFIMLLTGCFEWWKIADDYVETKKVLKKRTQIKVAEIISINEEVIPALILGVYKTNAAIIKTPTKRVAIYLNKKITIDYIRNLLNNQNSGKIVDNSKIDF